MSASLSVPESMIHKTVKAIVEFEKIIKTTMEDYIDVFPDMIISERTVIIPIGDGRIWKLSMIIQDSESKQENADNVLLQSITK